MVYLSAMRSSITAARQRVQLLIHDRLLHGVTDGWRVSFSSAARSRFPASGAVWARGPHEALALAVLVESRSARSDPATMPAIASDAEDLVGTVSTNVAICFQERAFLIGQISLVVPVGIRPAADDGGVTVRFRHREITRIDPSTAA